MFLSGELKKIDAMGLSFKDFTKLVYTAIGLVNGEEDSQGEQ